MSTLRENRMFFGSLQLFALANSLFLLLSLTRWFGGSAATPGVVDHLFGNILNFRVDFIWLVISTLALFFAGIACIISARGERPIWRTAVLCFAENALFLAYVIHAFHRGSWTLDERSDLVKRPLALVSGSKAA